MQPGSQIYVTIDHYWLAIIIFKWKKPKQSSYQFKKREQNVIAMHAGKGLYTSCTGKHGGRYKTNFITQTSSRFPNFDTSNAWQMGHNSREGICLGQELLLDFAAWLNLTLNADNTIRVYQLPSKFQNTFWFFKMCWWLTGLSRLYDASQPPGRHTRYFNTMLKILVDRALTWHIPFLFDGISFAAQSIHVLCSRHNNRCKQSVPRFPLYILFSFDFKTAKIQWNTL